MGYVNEAFNSDSLSKLPGSIAIGHVRYSTAGESLLLNAQPILVDSVHGQFAIGHNGNLVNAGELRDALVRCGAIFQTNSDTETMVHLFARSREENVEAAIIDAISQVRGAFSLRDDDQGSPGRACAIRTGSGRSPSASSATPG